MKTLEEIRNRPLTSKYIISLFEMVKDEEDEWAHNKKRLTELLEEFKEQSANAKAKAILEEAAEKVFNQTTHPALNDDYRDGWGDCSESSQQIILSLIPKEQ